MSAKREPLKEQDILDVCERYADNYPCEGRITVNRLAMRRAVEPLVEAARAKDAELIQTAQTICEMIVSQTKDATAKMLCKDFLDLCKAIGFKPSEQ